MGNFNFTNAFNFGNPDWARKRQEYESAGSIGGNILKGLGLAANSLSDAGTNILKHNEDVATNILKHNEDVANTAFEQQRRINAENLARDQYNLNKKIAEDNQANEEARIINDEIKAQAQAQSDADERNRNEEMAKLANNISEYRTKVSVINADKNIKASKKVAHTKGLQDNIDRSLQEYRNRFGEVAYKDLLDKMRQEDFMSKLSETQSVNIRKANKKAPEKTSLGGFNFPR